MTTAIEAMKPETEHAIQNAQGHAESILELYHAAQLIEDGAERAEYEGYEYDSDGLRERATEAALSVQVRSDWHNPGEQGEAGEFSILLTTGGPALRIRGELDRGAPVERGAPVNPVMEWQDWGTPWTEYTPEAEDWEEALEWFLGCYYFGD